MRILFGRCYYHHDYLPEVAFSLRSKRPTLEPQNNSVHYIDQALQLLRGELETRHLASHSFPPELSKTNIKAPVSRYQVHIENASKHSVCSSCGRFVSNSKIVEVGNEASSVEPLHRFLDYRLLPET